MKPNEIIALLEKAMGQQLDESILPRIAAIEENLKAVEKSQVMTGEELDGRAEKSPLTFSQYLGDLSRKFQGENPIHVNSDDVSKVFMKSLNEGTDASGGYLVPTEESRTLIDLTDNFSVIPPLCQQVPMRTNSIVFPTMSSGLTAYWIPEATSNTGTTQSAGVKQESTFTLSSMTITAHVCAVMVYVSTQLLDDSDPAVDKVLYSLFAKTIDGAFDTAILRGAGTTTDPITGLATAITTNTNTAGSSLDFDDVIDLIYDCYDNAQNASKIDVIGNTKAERQLLKIKDNDGQYIFKSPNQGGKALGQGTIWGEPWHRDGNVSNTLGSSSDKTRIFAGAFSESAYVGNRAQVIIKANPFGDGWERNQVGFLAEIRKGFQVDDESRFAKLEGIPTA